MPEIVLALIFVVLLFAFAFYGFVCFIKFLLTGNKPDSNPIRRSDLQPQKLRTLADDVLGTSHLLNFLFNNQRIDSKTYQRLRGFLEAEFNQHEVANRVRSTTEMGPQETGPTKTVIDGQGELYDVEVATTEDTMRPASPPGPSEASSPIITDVEVAIPPPSRGHEDVVVAAPPRKPAPRPAPWDLPDPPAREPRRSFSEMMAGFMLEKNIRWGELASGILIVGSAVGLIVSLRNELQDTIPYFSALLFMLITAAIHGAGIYTLKKWKLRTTSRGTLLIGLLLVPLNIIAACILSGNETDRRELSDPLLWVAIIVGLSSFTAMTWFSSKCLFRRGQLPLVIAVMGCAIGTLVINRANVDDSSLRKLLLGLPLAASFLIGTAAFYKRQWVRIRWPERATNRLFVFLGLSTFAFLTAASLLIVRADGKWAAVVALLPAFSLVALMTTWLGRIVWQGASGVEVQRLKLTGLTLHILGLSLMAVSLVASASNPTILLVNSAIASVGMILFAKHQEEPRLLPVAWAAFATLVLCVVNLYLDKLNWDGWASARELGEAALNGESGLSLLAAGAGVAGLHALYGGRAKDQSQFRRVGWYSGAAIFLVGCMLALAASFVNRDNAFDNMTATCLLGLASVLALSVCAQGVQVSNPPTTTESQVARALPHGTAVILLGFLAHAGIWNQFIRDDVNQTFFGINANWVLVFSVHAILLAAVAVIARYKISSSHSNSIATRGIMPDLLGEWSAITNVFALVGIFFLIRFHTGLATAIGLSLSFGWFMLVGVQSHHRFGPRYWVSWMVGATFVTVFVVVSELLTQLDWCPTYESNRFWLIQVIALSLVAIVWLIVSSYLRPFERLRKFADFYPRVERVLVHGLALLTVSIIATALVGGVESELFADANEPILSLTNDRMWAFGALAAVGVALLLTAFQRPSTAAGVGLCVVWLVAWGFGAEYFVDSRSLGSALRWLLPIEGLVGAAIVASRKPFCPTWAAARNRLGIAGKSSWPATTTQGLINLSLAVVAVIVLMISTIAIARVLMTGGAEALGGPLAGSWFGDLEKDVSYGIPVGIMVGTFLLYAISERRKWLATAGSTVFQYCVVLAMILLFASPHPKLASQWFVNILQSVSIGMTGYGFVWWFFKERIEGLAGTVDHGKAGGRVSQIEIHTLINGLLITSLAVLVIGRFYLIPDQAGDWINTVGGTLGVIAWASFGALAFFVWREKLNQAHRTSTWMWLACWLGLVLVGIVAASVDRHFANDTVPWRTFGVIMWGGVLVGLSQVALLWFERRPKLLAGVYRERNADRFTCLGSDQTLPLLFSGSLVLAFAIRGALFDSGSFWTYYTAIGLVLGFIVSAGLMRRSAGLSFISMALTTYASLLLVGMDPSGWFQSPQPHYANVLAIGLVLLALIWSGFYIHRSLFKGEVIRPSFEWMPNLVLLLTSIWVVVGAVGQWIIENNPAAGASSLDNPFGIGAIIGTAFLFVLHLWIDHRKFQVLSQCFWIIGLTVFVIAISVPTAGLRNASILLGLGFVVTIWGVLWANRESFFAIARKLKAPALIRLERSMGIQLSTIAFLMGCIVLLWAFVAIPFVEPRAERYLTAMSPFPVALGLGLMSNAKGRRWLQLSALTLLTVGAVFVAWADLSPAQFSHQPMRLFVRALLVFAGAMFVYGGLVARWVRETDTWLKSLRETAVATCGFALLCFGLVMWRELIEFRPDVGTSMPVTEAIAVTAVVFGMIVGLILIAVLPKNDPFSLSLAGRMRYVYAAQLVAAMMVAHLYLTMPKLFAFGIKDYWPYIAMILCFGGVGVAQVLEKRQLTVLGRPLFNSAAILPLAVAALIWGVDSKADVSLVMLWVGLAYLMISYTHQSILSGAAAIIFGNCALWLFYEKFDGFAFIEHPQLWLIPPALSVLVAAQLSRNSLTPKQLASVRYVCVTVIYLSSTSEVFISGMGQKLWPPMVLAVLAVGGIMAGIMVHVRAYLYLGSVFLLLAMISMVSHAHQRLDHVWPWWAFGIGMGVAILVMFGMFEKRRKDMKQIVGRLSEWDL